MSITRRLLLVFLLMFFVFGFLGHSLNSGVVAHNTQFESNCAFHTSVIVTEFLQPHTNESRPAPMLLQEDYPVLRVGVKIPHPPTI